MVGASKILTVSYGTFSCTLEGFDEPFSTMKAIAEYFRDLAADDRYFGATPPIPDADMLHRIAEREIHRRVEARISDHGVVLRPQADDSAPVEFAAAPMPAAPSRTAAEAPVKPSIPESVAQKLMRIRAVVSEEARAATPPVADEEETQPFEEDEATEDFAAAAPAPSSDFGFDLDFGDVPGVKADTKPAVQDTDENAFEDTSVAAADDMIVPTETEVMVEEAEPVIVAETDDLAEPQDDEVGTVAFEATAEPEVAEDIPATDEDILTEADESVDAEEEPLALAQTEATAEEEAEAEEEAPRATVIRIDRSAAKDDDDADAAGSFDLSEDAPIEDRTAAVMAALADRSYDDEDFEETAQATDSEADDSDILAQIGAAIGDTGLPDKEEEELLRDLAAVARDLRRDGHEGRAILENATEDDEASVSRLMEEAKSKLEGPENRRRFSAIAHLKAAVAATVADRKMKSGDLGVASRDLSGDDTERYRDDLSKAVRPRRPTSDTIPTTERPSASTRMAPLVLVSEQRIDVTEDTRKNLAVVRPRRVSAVEVDTMDDEDIADGEDTPLNPEDARSFAEFAERLGAVSLSDLLEAAAAYTATVEGSPHFSRPQIIKKVAHIAEDEDYSQEDSLRSFGMLLRQGKFQKVRRGQFMLSEDSRFMDEARRVGQ
jgi:hypothetical protein